MGSAVRNTETVGRLETVVDVVLSAVRLAAALVLVFLNGFFVASEFAYVRVRATAVESMVQAGKPGAKRLQTALDNLDNYLAVTQLGITVSSLGLGWIGEPAVAALIEPVVAPVLPQSMVHLVAFALGFGLITFLHVVFGELAPKTIAIAQAERIALLVSPPMTFFYYLFIPGIVVFNGTANAFTRLIGVPPASETEETLTEEEILMVLTRSGREGEVDSEEVEMVERVFELDDTSVREVMIPRPDVVSVPADTRIDELRTIVVETGHTRYPVTDPNEPDQVTGFVDVKDVVRADTTNGDEGFRTVGDIAREIPIVPESGRIDELLAELQREQRQMAAVIDEWGAFEGIATVEDAVEQIVGELRDDFDVPEREPSIEQRADGTYEVDGRLALSEANAVLETDLDADGIGTIGGLVLDRLGRAPVEGDRIETDEYVLGVDDVEGTRVATVVISDRDSVEEGPDDESPSET
jgi:CBS domain containing-hemolysin-like protein